MKRTWTIIGVSDVASSFKWYQSLFGQLETPPSASKVGCARAFLLDEPGEGVTWQRPPLVLPRRRF
jgi:hypothetical protein